MQMQSKLTKKFEMTTTINKTAFKIDFPPFY